MTDYLDQHYRTVAKALEEGRVVPLLGAGVNLAGRPPEASWALGSSYLPSGAELAEHLAREFGYPPGDLARVAETIAVMEGRAWLYDKLRLVFDADFQSTALHRFLARLPAVLRVRGRAPPYQLIVTTNYDDTLERAFRAEEEPYDLVWYVADGTHHRGKFLHVPPPQEGSAPRPVERPNEYDQLSLEERTVILKFHGGVDRVDADHDSYVITEDHYIDYLTRTDIANLVPTELVVKLKRSHFLFLGYALRDWNVRVILHRIWADRRLDYASWAIQRHIDRIDERMWLSRNVAILDHDLDGYVRALAERLQVRL